MNRPPSLALTTSLLPTSAAYPGEQPNVIIIYGAEMIPTPNLDKFPSQGIRFKGLWLNGQPGNDLVTFED